MVRSLLLAIDLNSPIEPHLSHWQRRGVGLRPHTGRIPMIWILNVFSKTGVFSSSLARGKREPRFRNGYQPVKAQGKGVFNYECLRLWCLPAELSQILMWSEKKKVYKQRLLCSCQKNFFQYHFILSSWEKTRMKSIKNISFVRTKQTKRLDPVKAVSLMKFMSLDYIRVNKDSVYTV